MLLGVFYCRKRVTKTSSIAENFEKQHEMPKVQTASRTLSYASKAELHGNTNPYALYILNLFSTGRAELHGTSNVQVMNAAMDRSELHGISASGVAKSENSTHMAELDSPFGRSAGWEEAGGSPGPSIAASSMYSDVETFI